MDMDDGMGAGAMPGEDQNESNKIKSKGLQHVFNQARDIFPKNPVPYYEDGDPDMYTPENLAKRETLRTNEIVREAIDTFMEDQFEMAKNKNMCTRESYLKVFTNIAFILKPGFEADELQSAIKADWDTDSQDPV